MDLAADVAVSAGSMEAERNSKCDYTGHILTAAVRLMCDYSELTCCDCHRDHLRDSAGSGGAAAWLPAPGHQSLRGGRGGKVTSRDQLLSADRGQVSEQVLVPGAHKHFLLHVTNIL